MARIAPVTGRRSPLLLRLLNVATRRPRFPAAPEERDRLIERFLHACLDGDLPALVAALAEDVTVRADGGGKVHAARKPVVGREKVAAFLLRLMGQALVGTTFRRAAVNGQPGLVVYANGRPFDVVTFDVADGAIRAVYTVLNPEKLRAVPALAG